MGNCERLVDRAQGDARYCHPLKLWFIFDGERYLPDKTGEIVRRAKQATRDISLEASKYSHYEGDLRADAGQTNDKEQKDACLQAARSASSKAEQLSKWAIKSEKSAIIHAAIGLAQSEKGVPVAPEELDTDPWLLNCKNCVIDLKTGAPLDHSRDRLITKQIPVMFDPTAQCPRFEAFLNEILIEPDVIELMQKAIGYALTGSVSEECMFIMHGVGRNGKGTLLKIMLQLLGDYGLASKSSVLILQRDESGPNNSVANMLGKRLVVCQETREGAKLDEAGVKWLTGGDKLQARRLHENDVEFFPVHKIFLASNHMPKIKGTDIGIWSRIRVIPFNVVFPEDRQNKNLKEELLEELPGILNWAIAGCVEYQTSGLKPPPSVVAATDKYRVDSNQVKRFIDDACETGDYFTIRAHTLFKGYREWCANTGEEAIPELEFSSRMATNEPKLEKKGTRVAIFITKYGSWPLRIQSSFYPTPDTKDVASFRPNLPETTKL